MGRRTLLLIAAAIIAVLGTTLVAFYASNANDRALAGQETSEVLVAAAEIPAGVSGADAAERGLFETKTLTADATAENALGPDDLDAIANDVAVSKIFPGEQIVVGKFGDVGKTSSIPIPAGYIAVSIDLPFARQGAGFAVPGSTVAVFNTGDKETGLIVPEALVVAVGQTSASGSDSSDGSEVSRTTLTLAVLQADAQKIIYASNNGTVDVALVNDESNVGPADRTNDSNVWA